MRKAKSPPKPNHYQVAWLGRIARSPLMKTFIDDEVRFSLQNGETVPAHTAKVLIRNGWVKPRRDGLFDDTQTYTALKP